MKARYGITAVALIASLALYQFLQLEKDSLRRKLTRSMTQTQTKQHFKGGSCTQTGTMGTKTKAGNAYGPGDGTG